MATVAQIISNAREDLKIDPNAKIWTDTQLTRWLNEGMALLAVDADWKDTKQTASTTLVNGTRLYTPASDYHRLAENGVIFTTSAGDESIVDYVEETELQGDYPDLTATGDAPSYIYETNGQFGFYPVPNATAAAGTLDYTYYEWPDTYVASDTPDFPAQWHFLLEHYIEYRAWGILPGREQSSQIALQKWEAGIRKMKEERLRREGPKLAFRTLQKEIKNYT